MINSNYIIRKNRKLKTTNSRGPPGVGFKLTEDGNYDILSNKLINVRDPEYEDDAVNLKTLNKLRDELNMINDVKLSELTSKLREELRDENESNKNNQVVELQKNLLRERLEVNRQFIKINLSFPFDNEIPKTISQNDVKIITDGIIVMEENSFKLKQFVYFLKITFLLLENENFKYLTKAAWFGIFTPHETVTKYLRPAFGVNTVRLLCIT